MCKSKYIKKLQKISLYILLVLAIFIAIEYIEAGGGFAIVFALLVIAPGVIAGIKFGEFTKLESALLLILITIFTVVLIILISHSSELVRIFSGLGFILLYGSISGFGLIIAWKPLVSIAKSISSKKSSFNKTQLPKWIHRFLSDEEKAAILIDYRIQWYGDKRPNKFIRFKVLLKTIHHLFYEVWFKERLDKIKSFQVRMPRW